MTGEEQYGHPTSSDIGCIRSNCYYMIQCMIEIDTNTNIHTGCPRMNATLLSTRVLKLLVNTYSKNSPMRKLEEYRNWRQRWYMLYDGGRDIAPAPLLKREGGGEKYYMYMWTPVTPPLPPTNTFLAMGKYEAMCVNT